MAKDAFTYKVVYNHFPAYAHGLESKVGAVVAKAALDIEGQAKMRAPVDTGFLKSSIQAVKIGPTHWRVTVNAEYGIYLEYGTVNAAAQPYLDPSITHVRPLFLAAMKAALTP